MNALAKGFAQYEPVLTEGTTGEDICEFLMNKNLTLLPYSVYESLIHVNAKLNRYCNLKNFNSITESKYLKILDKMNPADLSTSLPSIGLGSETRVEYSKDARHYYQTKLPGLKRDYRFRYSRKLSSTFCYSLVTVGGRGR